MAYNYDPAEFRTNYGFIADAANSLASGIRRMPDALEKDAAYKRASAQFKFDADQNKAVYDGLTTTLRSVGIDPKAVPQPEPNEKRDAYASRAGEWYADLAKNGSIDHGVFSGAVNKLSLSTVPAVQEQTQRQGLLELNDPMGTMAKQAAIPNMTPEQSDLAGLLNTIPKQSQSQEAGYADLQSTLGAIPAPDVDPVEDSLRTAHRTAVDQLRRGVIKPDEFIKMNQDIKSKELDLKIKEAEIEKERAKAKTEAIRAGKLSNIGNHPLKDSSGKTPDVNEANIDDLSMSQDWTSLATQRYGRRASGSGNPDKTLMDLMTKITANLNVIQDWEKDPFKDPAFTPESVVAARNEISTALKMRNDELQRKMPNVWRDMVNAVVTNSPAPVKSRGSGF